MEPLLAGVSERTEGDPGSPGRAVLPSPQACQLQVLYLNNGRNIAPTQ